MKILLTQVKESSRDFRLEMPFSLSGLKGRAERGKVVTDVQVSPAGERWYVHGKVEGSFPFNCDRCRSPFAGKLKGEFSFVVLSKLSSDLDPEESGELVVLSSGSQELDLSEWVQEALLLDLPMRLLCREDCRGLCPRCGANLNKEECNCEAEVDTRWSALQDLKKIMESADEAAQGKDRSDESEV